MDLDNDVTVATADEDVQVISLDESDPDPEVVYVPGAGIDGITEAELAAALEPYATKDYVLAAVATGGDISGVQTMIDTSIAVHRTDPTPHPTYDSMRDLTLLFENGMV